MGAAATSQKKKGRAKMRLGKPVARPLEHAELLFLLGLLGIVSSGGGGVDGLGFVGAGASVDVSRLDVDEGTLPQLGEVFAQRRLHFRHVKAFLNLRLYLLQRWNAFRLVLGYLENYPALIGSDGFGKLARLQTKNLIFELLRQRPALEVFEVAPLGSGWTAGIPSGEILKFRAFG